MIVLIICLAQGHLYRILAQRSFSITYFFNKQFRFIEKLKRVITQVHRLVYWSIPLELPKKYKESKKNTRKRLVIAINRHPMKRQSHEQKMEPINRELNSFTTLFFWCHIVHTRHKNGNFVLCNFVHSRFILWGWCVKSNWNYSYMVLKVKL